MPPVEQIKAKRAGVGLRACDHDRAFPGFTLFAPQSGGGKVYLIDIDGNVSSHLADALCARQLRLSD